jgi:hypothetical protein
MRLYGPVDAGQEMWAGWHYQASSGALQPHVSERTNLGEDRGRKVDVLGDNTDGGSSDNGEGNECGVHGEYGGVRVSEERDEGYVGERGSVETTTDAGGEEEGEVFDRPAQRPGLF